MGLAQTTAGYSDTLDLREVFALFRNNLGKIVLCIAVAIGIAVIYLSNARPTYKATALLEIAPNEKPNASEVDTAETLKTVELKMASQSVLLAVLKANHVAQDPDFMASRTERFSTALAEFLQQINLNGLAAKLRADPPPTSNAYSDSELVKRFGEKVAVKLVRGSRLISLTVEDHSPENAQHLAQAIIDEFFRQSRDERSRDSAGAREQLIAEAKRVGDEFRTSEEKLEAYRAKYQAVSLQERQNIVVERLRDLNQQVAAAKNARLAREAEADQVRRLADSDPERLLTIRSIADSPEILDLRKQVTQQEAHIATLTQRYGPLHPTMIQAQSELAEFRAGLQNGIRKAGNRLLQSFEAAKAMEAQLESSLAEQEKAALELDRIAIPYHALEREVQANGTVYQKLLDNLKQWDVSHGLTSSNDVNGIDIRIVEPPLAPIHPARPRQELLLALSAVTGLFFGCGLVLFSRALDNSVTSVDEAETSLGLNVLAMVPRSRHHRLGRHPLVQRYPSSSQAEAFRSLRTSLSLLNGRREFHTILFTSAMPGEGKSFCSLNCAASFAQQGDRTLLIDGDLRRPSLRGLFSDPNDKPQLTDCLRDPSLFSAAVQQTNVENLFCLGDWQHNAGSADLVAKDGMREIIRVARQAFDRVIIDTAPLMAVSDTLHIAKHVTTICLVIYAGKTPRRLARRALKLLQEVAGREATGLVMNKITSRSAAAPYYYYNA